MLVVLVVAIVVVVVVVVVAVMVVAVTVGVGVEAVLLTFRQIVLKQVSDLLYQNQRVAMIYPGLNTGIKTVMFLENV